MAMLIKGLQYIIPCQSRFLHRTNEQRIKEQYEMLVNTVTNCLRDNCMSASDRRAQEAFSELKTIVHELYVKKLSRHLNIRARYEHALVKNIRRLIDKQPHVIVRRTDKSKVFYIGKTDDFLHKAAAYMTTTNAYEIFSDKKSPLHHSLTAVQTLLGALLQEKVIDKKLCNKLLPKTNNLELAHLHFIPKPHKVCNIQSSIEHIKTSFFFEILGRHSIETYHCLDQCTDNEYFQVSQ